MIVLAAIAATTSLSLAPTATKVLDATPTDEEESLCLFLVDPIKLVYSLLNEPLLSTSSGYSFIEARKVALKLTDEVQPLLIWIRGCLVDGVPGIYSLDALNMEDRLTIRISKTLRGIVPEAPLQQQKNTTYIMQAAPRAPPPLAPSKKSVTLDERSELHKLALSRLCNVSRLDALPKIWRTLALLKK